MGMVKKQGLTEEHTLAPQAIQVLREYGLDADLEKTHVKMGKRNVDAIIRIGKGGQERLFVVEVKHRPTAATMAPLLQNKGRNDTLLVADFVAPALAEVLRGHHIPFVDLAGNAWLKTPDHLIWVNGRRPQVVTRMARPPRAFAAGGLQLIFGLLNDPDWVQLPTRTLADKLGIANGTVAGALLDLEALGFIAGKRAGKRRLRNREVLLNKWTEGYLQRLQQTTLINKYKTDEREADWWKRLGEEGAHALLGGEPAAALLTRFLTPELITIYVDGNPAKLVLKHGLRQAPDGKIHLRRKFWKFETPKCDGHKVVPPLLIYADLVGTNDARCIEAAGRIKEKYLAGLLED